MHDGRSTQKLSEVLLLWIVVPLPLQAFEPLSVQLSDASGTIQEDTHTLQFQVPHQHQHSQSQLGILAIASNGNLALSSMLDLLLPLQLDSSLTSDWQRGGGWGGGPSQEIRGGGDKGPLDSEACLSKSSLCCCTDGHYMLVVSCKVHKWQMVLARMQMEGA